VTLKRIVKLDTGSLSAGSFVDLVYAPEVDLKLKRIEVVETTANALNLLFMTFYLGDVPFFFPDVSAALFQPLDAYPIIFDLAHNKGVYLKIRVTNSDTTTRRLIIHLIYEE
jgi:hypothetical protein